MSSLPTPGVTTRDDGGDDRRELRIVVPRFGASVVGGAENAMRQLARALTVRGWSVEVWTTTAVDEATWSDGFAPGTEREGDIVVRRFPVLMRRRPLLFRRLSNAAYHLPRGLRAETLWAIAQGPYAPALVRELSDAPPVPTLFSPYLYYPTLYGLPAAPHPRILCPAAHAEPALGLASVRRALLAADGLWFHSPEERDVLLRRHPGAARLPTECGVVGVEPPAHIDAFAFAARHSIRGPYIYYGGRMADGKGIEQLLAGVAVARRSHPTLQLVLSGDGGDASEVPGVLSMGLLDERERWEAVAGAAAVAVPGTLESLSLLALEAWAMGRPCLLNAQSSVLAGHLARSGGGLSFHGSVEFARRAERLLDSPDEGAAMGAAGRAYVLGSYRWDLSELRLRTLIEAAAS